MTQNILFFFFIYHRNHQISQVDWYAEMSYASDSSLACISDVSLLLSVKEPLGFIRNSGIPGHLDNTLRNFLLLPRYFPHLLRISYVILSSPLSFEIVKAFSTIHSAFMILSSLQIFFEAFTA